ncbi:MAG: amidohydrolase family protein [Planctomycetaceae bacterium]
MAVVIRAFVVLILATASATVTADESSDHKVGLRENRPDVWALMNARVVIDAEHELSNATVVVRNGRIASAAAGAEVPADARVLDFEGRTIYPGFIDAYSEKNLSTDGLDKSPAHWNDNVVPQLSAAKQVLTTVSENEALRKQGIVARLMAPSGGIVRGQSAVVSTGTTDPKRAIVAAGVAQHLELTVNRRSRSEYPGSPMGAVALARQTMYDAIWYRDAWNAANADSSLPRPEHNDALVALQPVVAGAQPVVIETSNELFFLRADRYASEFGLNLIVRGSGLEYRRLNDIAATGRAVILPLNFSKPPNVSTPEIAANVTLESLLHWDLAPENPARVDDAGIRFAFTTNRLSSTDQFLKSLRKAVNRGLKSASALRALTETPAELFGVEDQLGSIHAGKLASFVVTDGDLFAKKTKVVETWVAGERFEHQPPPVIDVAATYELTIEPSGPYPRTLFVRLTRDGDKLKGRVSRRPFSETTNDKDAGNRDSDDDDESDAADDKQADEDDRDGDSDEKKPEADSNSDLAELKELNQSDYSVTGQFSAKNWSIDGATRLSLVLNRGDDAPAGFGRIAWPDGSTSTVSIARLESGGSAAPEKHDDSEEAPVPASFAVNFPLGAFGRESVPETAGLTAFQHATIWTSGPAGIIEDGTLLIDDGHIIAVGDDLEIPDGASVIDVQGMHITPGIIDCHSHMATDGGVNESTQAVTCEVRIGDFIDCDDITIYRQLAGGVTSSNILHGSANPIGGQNQVIKLRWGMNGEQMKFQEAPPGVKFALGENVKQSNWGNEYTSRYPQTRMGVEQIFRDSFMAAREYAAKHDAWQNIRRGLPPRRDLELDALREIVEQRRWIHCHSYRQDEILALIRLLDEFDITIGTFQHILEGYKVADAMAEHGAMGSAFADWWAYKFEVIDAIPYTGALMHRAGVVVSFNSDDAELARRLNQEAAKAVKYGGVAPEEALKFVTLNPAKQLRIEEYVGSLEPGKHADFVVWNGSPLSNYSRCEQTWIDGCRYFHRDDDARQREKVADMRNTLIQKILTSKEKMRGADEQDDDPSAMWPRHDEFCHHGHDHEHLEHR